MVRSQASSLPGHIQAVYVHNIIKLAAYVLNKAVQENDTDVMEQVSFNIYCYMNFITQFNLQNLRIKRFHFYRSSFLRRNFLLLYAAVI